MSLLKIPALIVQGTLSLFVNLCLTVIGIPVAFCVLVCGLALALVMLGMLLLPVFILVFI